MTTRLTRAFVTSTGPILLLLLLQLTAQINAHNFRLIFEDIHQQQQQQQHQSTVTDNSRLDEMWSSFKTKYDKSYADNDEESYRHSVWLENVARVQTHNLQADLGLHTFTLGINEYSDLTMAEYKNLLLGTRPPANYTAESPTVEYDGESSDYYDLRDQIPDSVDWRTQGYVTPVKNQGSCGSCWAFSSTGALEGQNFKKTGTLVSLSEQNLVDCSKTCGNNGCGGGWMSYAFRCVSQQGGIDTEESYLYEGKDGACRFKTSTIGAKCTGYKSVTVGDEDALKQAVANIGPISVAIDANHGEFFQYKSGVLDIADCTGQVDHAVLVVGYGTRDGQDYWLVKNSWGTSWGINGYVMMSRNKNNQCSIASYAIYPTM